MPGTNLAAGRVTYDVNSNLRVGSDRDERRSRRQVEQLARGAGRGVADVELPGRQEPRLRNLGGESFGESAPADRDGWGVKAQYPNDLWDIEGSFKQFGDSLDPALGFLPRPGTRQYTSYVAYQPRPAGPLAAFVRQFFFELNPVLVDRPPGRDAVVSDVHGAVQHPEPGRRPLRGELRAAVRAPQRALRDLARRRDPDRELLVPSLPRSRSSPPTRGRSPSEAPSGSAASMTGTSPNGWDS